MLIHLTAGKECKDYILNTERIIKITEGIWTVVLYDNGKGLEEITVEESVEDILNLISK